MSHQISQRLALVVAAFALAIAPQLKAADAFAYVPKDAYGFVVVNNVSQMSDKIESLLAKFDAPVPSLTTFLQVQTGMAKGVNFDGDLLFAVLPGKTPTSEPAPLVMVPITDYKALATSLDADPSGKPSEISISSLKFLIAKKDDYALLTKSDFRSTLESVLQQDVVQPKASAPYLKWAKQQDVFAAILPKGARVLTSVAKAELAKAKEQLQDIYGDTDTGYQMEIALDMYDEVLDMIGTEVNAVVFGMTLDKSGNVLVGERVILKSNGTLAQLSSAEVATDVADNLVGLPSVPFMMAGAGPWPSEWTEASMKAFSGFFERHPEILQLYGVSEATDEDIEQLKTMALGSLSTIESMAMCFGLPGKDKPLISGMVFVMGVADSSAFMKEYKKSADAWDKLTEGGGDTQLGYDVVEEEIAGKPGIKIAMDMSAMIAEQPGAEMMFEMMYGEGGKLNSYIAVVDKRRVLTGLGDKETVEKMVASLRKGGDVLADEPLVRKTRSLLPKDAAMVGYVSPKGWVDFVRQMMESIMGNMGAAAPSIPDFPETPPVGLSVRVVKGVIEVDLAIPVEMINGISEYARKARSL